MCKISFSNKVFLLLNERSIELFNNPLHKIDWSKKIAVNYDEKELINYVQYYYFLKKERTENEK